MRRCYVLDPFGNRIELIEAECDDALGRSKARPESSERSQHEPGRLVGAAVDPGEKSGLVLRVDPLGEAF